MSRIMPAGNFKQHCLRLMDEVKEANDEIVITKRGIPVAKLVPIKKHLDPFGCMRGTIEITGDIMEPLDVEWEAMKDE